MCWKITLVIALVVSSCKSKENSSSTLTTFDSNTANKPSTLQSQELRVQTFKDLPVDLEKCTGLFVREQDSAATVPEYIFVSNLKGVAFLKLNDRLMEVRLIRQTNIDKFTVNELYANEEVEIDLKIKQTTGVGDQLNYKGVLIIRQGPKREVVNISGRLGC